MLLPFCACSSERHREILGWVWLPVCQLVCTSIVRAEIQKATRHGDSTHHPVWWVRHHAHCLSRFDIRLTLTCSSVSRQVSEVENVAVSDGRRGQTLPRQLGVSHEPRRQTGQVQPEPSQRLGVNTLFNHSCFAESVSTGGMYFVPS